MLRTTPLLVVLSSLACMVLASAAAAKAGDCEATSETQLMNFISGQQCHSIMARGFELKDSSSVLLRDALREDSPALINLSFSGTSISDFAAANIGSGLLNNTHLTSIVFWDNGFASDGAKAIARGVAADTSQVTKLHITDNAIKDEGAASFGVILGDTKLKALVLTDCSIGPAGGAQLSAGLIDNQQLESLVLTGLTRCMPARLLVHTRYRRSRTWGWKRWQLPRG